MHSIPGPLRNKKAWIQIHSSNEADKATHDSAAFISSAYSDVSRTEYIS
jgi:hypothetical protein